MKIILEMLGKRPVSKIPIWFMRQAGRYLPEYLELTENSKKSFFQIIDDTELATKITLQPIKRFKFDSAIIFSDILFLPRVMGCDIEIIKGFGPKVKPITSSNELNNDNLETKVRSVSKLVKSVKSNLNENTALIGFAGGVFTVAAYIIGSIELGEGKLLNTKTFMYKNKKEFQKIIDILIESTVFYLNKQIENGAEIIQIFDSLAGDLTESDFDDYIIKPTKKIFQALNKCYKIGFPKGAGEKYIKYVHEVGLDAISVDYTLPLEWILDKLTAITVVQGNLDPYLLAFDNEKSIIQTEKILEKLAEERFIFNLGHGILKNTPIQNVENVIKIVREYNRKEIN